MLKLKAFFLTLLCTLSFSVSAEKMVELVKPTPASVEVFFILDRSGSMRGLEDDTIGGFNSMLEKQKKEDTGKTFITTALFDHEYELLHDHVLLSDVKPITNKEYFVRGYTALLDAIGHSIVHAHKFAHPTSKVLFVIITDGEENSSREFRLPQIKKMIELQQKQGWEFLFLGANIDAIGTADSLGISKDKAVTYQSDKVGTQKNYEVLSEVIKDVRKDGKIKSEWKKEIEEDVKNRK